MSWVRLKSPGVERKALRWKVLFFFDARTCMQYYLLCPFWHPWHWWFWWFLSGAFFTWTEEVKWRLYFVGMGSLPTEGLLLGFRSFEVPPAAPLSEFWACSRALYSRATPRSHTQVSFLHCTRRTFPAIVTEMEESRRANRYKTFFHWNSITSLFSFSFKKDFFPCF